MNNPTAFPLHPEHWQEENQGMTLRDYFAAQALTGAQIWDAVINGKNAQFTATEKLAEVAYEIADAMMKAREQ